MVEIRNPHFNLEQICQSGQCFRMKPINEIQDENVFLKDSRYEVIAGDRYLEIAQKEDYCRFFCSQEEFDSFWKGYFDLEQDYEMYIRRISPGDTYLLNAAAFGMGIRILRQDLWEMIVSFLISQQNNIIRIRRCIDNICKTYGEKMNTPWGAAYYSFPAPQTLAELTDDALMACNLGYRSKYVVQAARRVVSGEMNLEEVRGMPYEKAKAELLKMFGVGEKVADCICLFALHHLEAFPVDTHISQALQAHYKRGFPKKRYKGCQGVLQQYIFYYELKSISK
ncbi:MAG: 8-oxoguanine DNA glycosylase [Hungatella sp.]|jgi:N-glycosylase/DNA lyase|nr:8-oxoguanine DNA glycosylase [Hungatella sp.]